MVQVWRFVFALLGSVGMAIIYGLKVNLSVAIVAMVNQTAVKEFNRTHEVHGNYHHIAGTVKGASAIDQDMIDRNMYISTSWI